MDARRLPWPIRRLLRPIRNPRLLEGVLQQIEHDVLLAHGYTEADLCSTKPITLHEADRDKVLDSLASDPNYLRRVRKLGHRARRVAHLDWVHRSDREVLPEYVPRISIPESGLWKVREDLDIGTSPYLGSMPDELAVGLVQELARRFSSRSGDAWSSEMAIYEQMATDIGLDDDSRANVRVLVIGAGPCTFAHAVDAVDHPLVTFRVVEVEPIPSERETLCVEARHEDLGPVLSDGDQYDAVVLHLPAPAGPGGERQRFAYYEPNLYGIPTVDLARLGLKKWSIWTMRLIQVLPLLVRQGGVVHIYSPCGVRTRRSYEEHPGLQAAVAEALGGIDLDVFRNVEVMPDASIKQSFVGQERCGWHLVSGTFNEKDGGDA